jgi:Zn-dependent protease
MIPIPPLDGSKVLLAVLPSDMASSLERIFYQAQYLSLILLMALFWIGGGFISLLITGPAVAMFRVIVGRPPFF